MIAQQCTPQGYVRVVATTAVAQALASVIVSATTTYVVPTQANLALIVVEGAPVRWRDDGTAPTPSTGMLIQPTLAPLEYSGNIAALSFIPAVGTTTMTVDVSLYKIAG